MTVSDTGPLAPSHRICNALNHNIFIKWRSFRRKEGINSLLKIVRRELYHIVYEKDVKHK